MNFKNKPITDDTRILRQKPLLTPAYLLDEIRANDEALANIAQKRQAISHVLAGTDDRLLVVAGPCSIHDIKAAKEYAEFIKKIATKFERELIVVMRTYFEKPRTVIGWKGLINDPFVDGTFQINKGLRIARELLNFFANEGVATATEFLDPITPQFISDLVSYGAIGARTTESQIHRELASGMSMPIGFKNGTDGSAQVAVDAVAAAHHSHWFPSVTKDGVVAIFETAGNRDTHVILRGGKNTGPNYAPEFIADVVARLEKAKLPPHVVIDCSHGNSNKDYRRQPIVAREIADQIAAGTRAIVGVMIESNLVEGRQDYDPATCVYGKSITDACINTADTEAICEFLAAAVKTRRERANGGNEK